jgi:2-polyprenyl-3-methyl-5-hydroxy-6-metoxy-1,4-benzoquinol methylase
MILNCPICNNKNIFNSWNYETYKIYECLICSHEFTLPFKSGDVEYYKKNEIYFNLKSQMLNNLIPSTHFDILNKILKTIKSNFNNNKINIFDFGCGSGFYLHELKKRGYEDSLGVDFNEEVIEAAKEVYGVNAKNLNINDLIKNNSKYDLILLNQVLEHVDNPVELVKNLHKLLNNDGILFISVPNINYFKIKKLIRSGNLPSGNYPPHHISFFNKNSLKYLLELCDTNIIECDFQTYPDYCQFKIDLKNKYKLLKFFPNLFFYFFVKIGSLFKINGINLFSITQKRIF